jgi:hypothetical protein
MSIEAVQWALDDVTGLRSAVILVLIAMAERADKRGESCFPGITELARRGRTSRRRVIEAIHELEASGAIQVRRSVALDGKRRGVPVRPGPKPGRPRKVAAA